MQIAVVLICLFLVCAPVLAATVSITDFGAKGDGTTDCSPAFEQAIASGASVITVPAGTWLVGPEGLKLPDNTALIGEGPASVLKLAAGTVQLLELGSGCRLERLAFDGTATSEGNLNEGVVRTAWTTGVTIRDVSFDHCDRSCLLTDNAAEVTVEDCTFRDIALAIHLVFSKRCRVSGNRVERARIHGIQFWGNWKWERHGSEDLLFTGNWVKEGGGGGIWGCGADRVTMTGNIVDGVTDVGLDVEWCNDVAISGNVVKSAANAGISCFFSCKRVAITGNTILNDHPYEEPDPPPGWWCRAGIWLTAPNPAEFAGDLGHEAISIVGNVIHCEGGIRRAVWLPEAGKNIHLEANVLSGGGVWIGDKQVEQPLHHGIQAAGQGD